ncbi:dTDP-4-dehydrorhamnose 3,5-epimerase [Bacteroidales bacterium OttesenSCG-928-K03]|nr:dTDP-4-dehydrorhamnose 3,5-epimerase [Odoribacter sp. OttesenSCG-928-L07]MDL2238920.1 dTDP-4-dehydrorhamnose 3,5-epimerase [Bacteroidales bacterium OttesenSCG-928-L14]MDL2242895.1 dTDP-4-dehydrorhamnose 3,5-epimerase [Bacteroidales bacterium OttesenSCG-928-K03]
MEIIKELTKGLYLIKPKVFEDERGYFMESYQKKVFENIGLNIDFVQDNESCSKKGVIRGLHFQNPPFSQIKLIRVVSGSVFDVAVDIRKDSPTYGQWFGEVISADNKLMFLISEGFAHGFQALEDNTIFQYKCSNYYNKESEDSLLWNDENINIEWKDISPTLSAKDLESKTLKDFNSKFRY